MDGESKGLVMVAYYRTKEVHRHGLEGGVRLGVSSRGSGL